MLAENLKTATELRIADAEFSALRTVLGMLERGDIPREEFAMADFDCGTTACICGWARRIGGDGMFPTNHWLDNNGLHQLFGDNRRDVINCREPSQAATALRNYLTHGTPRWSEALAA